jgi:NAD(P)-dependent dehydrogenase (short-subunit alcohol dehydrogenase family)
MTEAATAMPAAALTSAPDHAPLRGRVALITGGSRGLGAATAQALGAAGMRLVLADIAAQRVQDFAATLAERDVDAIALPLDVSDPAACAAAVDAVVQRFGRLDALINNAAIDITAPVAGLTVDDWQRIVAVNLTAPFVLSKLAAAVMARQGIDGRGDGHIVNITSTAAKRAWPNASAYHATKWGLLGLSHALHAELRPQGIKVTAIVPALRIAMISEHASPLAAAGGVDSGGQNVYVAEVARCLAEAGHRVDVFTRRDDRRCRRCCGCPRARAWCTWTPARRASCRRKNCCPSCRPLPSAARRPGRAAAVRRAARQLLHVGLVGLRCASASARRWSPPSTRWAWCGASTRSRPTASRPNASRSSASWCAQPTA